MAAGTSLVISYENSSGGTTNHTWKYAKANASLANVKTLIQTTIANGDIFASVPVAVKSAKLVTTTEQTYDLSALMMAGGQDSRNLISSQPVEEEHEPGEEVITVQKNIAVETLEQKRARLKAELAALG